MLGRAALLAIFAVMVLFEFIVTTSGFWVLLASPLQPRKTVSGATPIAGSC